ncbi:AMP-binding protein [Sphingomonas sp. KRR8]|uniref:AMP-binding protein n=1 Tax=Sphingomonas sp. KRR8 TaxID=2942996 RepID=UPI002020D06F|nr:AMP-binding protein [Sphingomonas sp. KRR8]URD61727.1 AMP-binding protein [Sphingomonas sp. KRR8]
MKPLLPDLVDEWLAENLVGAIWTEHYCHPGGWKQSFDPPPVHALLERAAANWPNRVALDFYGRSTTYAALLDRARHVAKGLQSLGLQGKRVGLFLPNTPHYPAAFYGALLAGATVVNFSPLYSPDEVLAQTRNSGIEAIVCLDLKRLWPPIQRLLDERAVSRVIVGDLAEVLPWPQALGFRLLKRGDRQKLQGDARISRWSELLANDGAPAPVSVEPAKDLALIQFTGGTTGVPKGAALTHANLSVNALQLEAIDPTPRGQESRVLGCLPLFHIFAIAAILNRSVLGGAEIVLLPKFEAREALAALKRRRCTDFAGVPAMFQAMIEDPAFTADAFTDLKQAFSGGAAMTPALKERFEAASGSRVLEGYGMTESAGVVSVNPYEGEARAGTVGQPLPATLIRIVGEDGAEQPLGQAGEIVVSGPQIMQGYWRPEQKTIEPLANGEFRTGDIGIIEADGYVRIVDRIKDMINVGGFKVFPSQLEAVLASHPAVEEAIVVASPDERVGERPYAFVVLKDGVFATPADLSAFLAGHVGKHERLAGLELRDALPRTMIGKPDRKALAAAERARVEGGVI